MLCSTTVESPGLVFKLGLLRHHCVAWWPSALPITPACLKGGSHPVNSIYIWTHLHTRTYQSTDLCGISYTYRTKHRFPTSNKIASCQKSHIKYQPTNKYKSHIYDYHICNYFGNICILINKYLHNYIYINFEVHFPKCHQGDATAVCVQLLPKKLITSE